MSRRDAKITLASNLESFFGSQVQETARKQGVELDPFMADYLARLLARFADTKQWLVKEVLESNPEKETLKFPTLVDLYSKSLGHPLAEQFFQFQHLGDVALFTTGFFAERLNHISVDMDYYTAMGEMAYQRAGKIKETLAAEKALNIYFELSKNFQDCTEIFAELSEQSLLSNDKDLLKLYEKWLRTKSFRIARVLSEQGIIAHPKGPRDNNDPSSSGNVT